MKVNSFNELILDDKVVKGFWELNNRHEVIYRSDVDKKDIKIKSTLVDLDSSNLVVAATHQNKKNQSIVKALKLRGSWTLDSDNKIKFELRRRSSKANSLTFKSQWNVHKNQIIYTYKSQDLKTKKRIERKLVFKGYWGLSDKNRLVYSIEGNANSTFDIKGSFQTHSILAKKGELRYQVGLNLKKRIRGKALVLFGKWKMSNKFAVSFEISYKNGESRSIRFNTTYQIDSQRKLKAVLKKKSGKPIGVEVIFTKNFTEKKGNFFIKFHKSVPESRIEAGAAYRW